MLTQVAKSKKPCIFKAKQDFDHGIVLVQVPAELGADFSISQMNLQTEFICWAHSRTETSTDADSCTLKRLE